MRYMPTLPRRDAGIYLTEVMISVTMMAVVVLGLTTILVVQAQQMARDKILNDLYTYADMVLAEATSALGGSYEVQRGSIAGGRLTEDLEFAFQGVTNNGRKLESRLSMERNRRVLITENGTRPPFVDQFPPPEVDPEHNRDTRYRINVIDFSLHGYRDRLIVNPRISNILSELVLVLELEDRQNDYKLRRVFRRIVTTPNKHIAENRQLASGQG